MADAGVPEDGLAEWQELVLATDTLQDFLGEVAAAAARDVGGEMSCGVTVRTHERRPTTPGASDSFAAALDEAQYSEGQGPCLHALNTGAIVTMLDISTDERWPRFTELSAAQGAKSSLSMPMSTAHTGVVGALNVYSRAAHAFTAAEHDQAARFADLATGAATPTRPSRYFGSCPRPATRSSATSPPRSSSPSPARHRRLRRPSSRPGSPYAAPRSARCRGADSTQIPPVRQAPAGPSFADRMKGADTSARR